MPEVKPEVNLLAHRYGCGDHVNLSGPCAACEINQLRESVRVLREALNLACEATTNSCARDPEDYLRIAALRQAGVRE